jgi:predicted nucleic acid-binding protein
LPSSCAHFLETCHLIGSRFKTLSASRQRQADEWERAGLLHAGESQALALSLELKVDWFLTDDAAARLMAESLNIEAHGSIGIVLWAAATAVIQQDEARQFLANLENSSLWMSLPYVHKLVWS